MSFAMPFKNRQDQPHLFLCCSQLTALIRKCFISDLKRHILSATLFLGSEERDGRACYLSCPLTERFDLIISSYENHIIKSENRTNTKTNEKANGR